MLTKFYVSGHCYMSRHRDFGLIEAQKRYHPYIFLSEDWMRVVSDTSKKFKVIGISSDDTVHIEQLLKSAVHSKVDQNGEKVEWLRFRVESPFKIFFKYSVDENVPFRYLDISRKKPKRRQGVCSLNERQTPTDVSKRSMHQSCQAQGFRLSYLPLIIAFTTIWSRREHEVLKMKMRTRLKWMTFKTLQFKHLLTLFENNSIFLGVATTISRFNLTTVLEKCPLFDFLLFCVKLLCFHCMMYKQITTQ